MNPVDPNINNIRTQRSDVEQGQRRTGVTGTAAAAPTSATPSTSEAGVGEAVSFTQTASDLLSLEAQLRELPGIDQARVDSIRESIDNGSYEIDAQRIVENLLRSEQELR